MLIKRQEDVTDVVVDAFKNAADPRVREILTALVKHLHGFARDVHLTEEEFEKAVQLVVQLGQKTTDTHNEAVLMSGSLGFSTLICLLNNGNNGQTETTANLLGPFWRMNSPRYRKRRLDRAFADAGAGAVRQLHAQGHQRRSRSKAPRSTSGIPRRTDSTNSRTPIRPT